MGVHLEPLKPRSLKVSDSGQSRGSVTVPAAAKGFLIVLCWESFDYFVSGITATVFSCLYSFPENNPWMSWFENFRVFLWHVRKMHFAVGAAAFKSFFMAWPLNVCLSFKLGTFMSNTINYIFTAYNIPYYPNFSCRCVFYQHYPRS